MELGYPSGFSLNAIAQFPRPEPDWLTANRILHDNTTPVYKVKQWEETSIFFSSENNFLD